MSIYTRLLRSALNQPLPSDVAAPARDPGEEPLLSVARPPVPGTVRDKALSSLVDQLAYDVALVRLADRHGIHRDLDRFDQPGRGRLDLEEALTARGVLPPS